MKFSACIDMMYPELDLYERPNAAAHDCADAVEFWKWSDKNIDIIAERCKSADINISLMNIDSSDEKLSRDLSRGILSHGRTAEFVSALRETVPVMKKLGMDKIIVLAGDIDSQIPHELALDNIFNVLKAASPIAEEYGISLLLEPLNSFDRESYVMPCPSDAFKIVRGISSTSVKVLYDIYHAKRMGDNLQKSIVENISYIGHFHVANSPLRCEPDFGEIDYKKILNVIEKTGYQDYVGFEYRQKNLEFSLNKYIKNLNFVLKS